MARYLVVYIEVRAVHVAPMYISCKVVDRQEPVFTIQQLILNELDRLQEGMGLQQIRERWYEPPLNLTPLPIKICWEKWRTAT
jgi:hypothetical protein